MHRAATDGMAFALADAGAARMLGESNVDDLLGALRRARSGDPSRAPLAMTPDELHSRVRDFASRHPESVSASLDAANTAFARDTVLAVDRERGAARKLAWSNAGGQRLLHHSMGRPMRDGPAATSASLAARQTRATREQLEKRPIAPPDGQGRSTLALWKW